MTNTPGDPQAATIAAVLEASRRKGKAAPIRRDFVQQGPLAAPEPGPLQRIVKRHDTAALDLFLLLMASATAEPWDVTRDARVWARAIGHGADADGGRSTISKTWRRLDAEYHLIRRERHGRLARITPLDESGDGSPYTAPTSRYFKLPFAYWTADETWYRKLTLPAKTVLLIGLTLRQPFALPADRGPAWYGISSDTIDRGQRELRNLGLLERRYTTVNDYLTGKVVRTDYTFSLQPPFKASTKKETQKKGQKKGKTAPAGDSAVADGSHLTVVAE